METNAKFEDRAKCYKCGHALSEHEKVVHPGEEVVTFLCRMTTTIQKAESDVCEAQTRLIHIKAALDAYPDAVYENGRIRAAGVNVLGMEWVAEIGKRGAYVFFGEVPSERGPARVYDRVALPIEILNDLPSTHALACALHELACDRWLEAERDVKAAIDSAR